VTSPLILKAARLKEQVSVLENAVEHRRKLEGSQKATSRLRENRGKLAAQTELIAAMRADDRFPVAQLTSRAQVISALLNAATRDLPAAVEEHQIEKISDALTALSQELRSIIERNWKDVADQARLTDVLGLLEALTHVQSYRQRATTLLQQANTLQHTLGNPVGDATSYRQFQQQLQTFLAAVNSLKIGDKPGLEEFLKDAVAGLATLNRLTPPITSWIDEQGLSNHFFIRPGAPRG
jgi:hypothetical protein